MKTRTGTVGGSVKRQGILNRRFVADDGRKPTKEQHRKPCADCPWARAALPGWLGSNDAATWLRMVHGEDFIDCHCTTNQQCAGAAIFRANVIKCPRSPDALRLPADTKLVFTNDQEFLKHHTTPTQPQENHEKAKQITDTHHPTTRPDHGR